MQSSDALLKDNLPLDLSDSGGYFLYVSEEVLGPLSVEEVVSGILEHRWDGETPVWMRDFPSWSRLKHIKDFGPVQVPTDTFPLAVLMALILCFTVFFAMSARNQLTLSAKAPLAAPLVTGKADSFDLKICNLGSSAKVYAAIAYYDYSLKDWVARGWYPQRSGECRLALKNLTPPVYGFAETKDGITNWAGDQARFCIDSQQAFVNHQGDCSRNIGADRFQGFEEIPLDAPQEDGVLTWEIR